MRSEQAVYEAVMGWVRHDVASRKAWLGEVLGVVRMALLPLEYLVETVGVDPLVTESLEALRIFAAPGPNVPGPGPGGPMERPAQADPGHTAHCISSPRASDFATQCALQESPGSRSMQ